MTSIRAGSELLFHPEFELICQTMEGIEEHDHEMEIPLLWFLMFLLLEADASLDDIPPDDTDNDGEINDDEADRRKKWTAWRKKVRKEFAKQLRKKGFGKNVLRQIITDYIKAILPKPSAKKMAKFIAKWLWSLKKVLDAYKAAKKKVGPPPDNNPPPPEEIDGDELPNLDNLLFDGGKPTA